MKNSPKTGNIKNISELYSLISKKNSRNNFIVLLSITFVLLGAVVVISIVQRNNEELRFQEFTQLTSRQIYQNFLDDITSETPSLVFIEDPIRAQQDNPEAALFYRNAKKDDVMFVFKEKGFVILYRPQTREVINMGMVTNLE